MFFKWVAFKISQFNSYNNSINSNNFSNSLKMLSNYQSAAVICYPGGFASQEHFDIQSVKCIWQIL